MKLAERATLINDLIRENPDVTIKDYLEIVKELELIESTSKVKPKIDYKLPIDYKKYPSNWREIRNKILDREGHCCKTCKVKNGSTIFRGLLNGDEVYVTSDMITYRLADGECLGHDYAKDVQPYSGNPLQRAIKVVLTIAHLNHDIKDNRDENLAALCQLHHLRLDSAQHRKNARKTRENKSGLQRLFK